MACSAAISGRPEASVPKLSAMCFGRSLKRVSGFAQHAGAHQYGQRMRPCYDVIFIHLLYQSLERSWTTPWGLHRLQVCITAHVTGKPIKMHPA